MASNSASLGRSTGVSFVDLLDFFVAALVAMKVLHTMNRTWRFVSRRSGRAHQALLQSPGKYFLGQFATDENHLGARLFAGGPWFSRLGSHHHVHALEEHAPVHSLHVKDALVAQQVRAVHLDHAAQ